ncbi:MAG: hypothetical protein IPP04_03210 [Saprospiraceae bacterium]|nr:hypothetical protein [Saprospiraceae bacterium]
MFWENVACGIQKDSRLRLHLATMFKKYRKANPNTFIMDTGDMFQGSMLSIKTQGGAYTRLSSTNWIMTCTCLANWEVSIIKSAATYGGLNGPKVCANMYHDLGDGAKGELYLPAYYYTWMVEGTKIGFWVKLITWYPWDNSCIQQRNLIYQTRRKPGSLCRSLKNKSSVIS